MVLFGVNVEFRGKPGVILNDDFDLADLVDFAVVKVELFKVGVNEFFLFMEVGFGRFE
jgi:hypothetical protein